MTTPIDPEQCVNTGRMLTEWFEFPEYDEDQVYQVACERNGTTPEEMPRKGTMVCDLPDDKQTLQRKINGFVAARKRTRFVNGMNKQEVQHRLNEATKMISPDNYKFLDDQTRERTGLEINPLWMMECLVRSGVLSAKEQVAALKELAGYTHSKAASISHTTTTSMKPEDWLLELAKDEYKTLDEVNPIRQPMQAVERGAGKQFEQRKVKRTAEVENLVTYGEDEMEAMMAMVDAEWEEDD